MTLRPHEIGPMLDAAHADLERRKLAAFSRVLAVVTDDTRANRLRARRLNFAGLDFCPPSGRCPECGRDFTEEFGDGYATASITYCSCGRSFTD